RRDRALPHLGLVNEEGDGAVRRDVDERVQRGVRRDRLFAGGEELPARKTKREKEAARAGEPRLQKLAAVDRGVHSPPPTLHACFVRSAARWIARRIAW